MDITGKVIAVLETQRFNGKNGEIVKNQFVIETKGEYPKKCVFVVFGEDKWSQMGIAVGVEAQVFFDINAREWNGKWYNDITAYRVSVVGDDKAKANAPTQTQAVATQAQGTQTVDDGLPF